MGAAMSKTNVKAQQEKRFNWGNWKLNHETPVLEYANFSLNGAGFYEIDLDRMTSSAEMLDAIFQVAGKRWISNEDIGDLVRALDDLLDPQAHLCSNGKDKAFHPLRDK
jgi:hypothetical protein